jgi:hypothetical protein
MEHPMIGRDHATWTFSDDPLRGILVTLGWSDVAEPDREPADQPGLQHAGQGNVVPLRPTSHALMSATTITRLDPDREPIAS